MLRYFFSVAFAQVIVRMRREVINKREFEFWLPGELERRLVRLGDRERQRLLRQNNALQKKEEYVHSEMRHHLDSADGQIQITELAGTILAAAGSTSGMQLLEAKKIAERQLLGRCRIANRALELHDLEARDPALYKCAHYKCSAIFLAEEQYHTHLQLAPMHAGKPPQYSHFHITMRSTASALVIGYFIEKGSAFSGVANALQFWCELQEWRRIVHTQPGHIKKLMSIYEKFLKKGSPHFLQSILLGNPLVSAGCEDYMQSNDATELVRRIENVADRDFDGFFQHGRKKRGAVRRLLGLEGRLYERWTEEFVFLPDMFDEIEWLCFLKGFYEFEKVSSNIEHFFPRHYPNNEQIRS